MCYFRLLKFSCFGKYWMGLWGKSPADLAEWPEATQWIIQPFYETPHILSSQWAKKNLPMLSSWTRMPLQLKAAFRNLLKHHFTLVLQKVSNHFLTCLIENLLICLGTSFLSKSSASLYISSNTTRVGYIQHISICPNLTLSIRRVIKTRRTLLRPPMQAFYYELWKVNLIMLCTMHHPILPNISSLGCTHDKSTAANEQ